jgi:hypothetical protein
LFISLIFAHEIIVQSYMRKSAKLFCTVLTAWLIFFIEDVTAQCVFASANGYSVTVDANPVSIIAPASCPYGYNYNLNVVYNVSFTGSNIPSGLYTLQGNIFCGSQTHFFSLPLSGGSGTVTTVSNPYRTTPDCATATVGSLNCNATQITINGPGLATQTTTCAAAGPLPVTLISFNAMLVKTNSVYLQWVTANEISNASFTVERSTDAQNWKAVTVIRGAVNAATTIQYQYTDTALNEGIYYYRLKQTNINSTISYSAIIGAKISVKKTMAVSVTQVNPDQIYISGLADSKNWSFTLLNTQGAIVAQKNSLTSDVVTLSLLSKGIYIIKLQHAGNGEIKTIKFLKY